MKRRESLLFLFRAFFVLFSGVLGACSREPKQAKKERVLSLAKPQSYPQGVTLLALERIVVVRDEEGFRALSAVCTHMPCALKKAGSGLLCPCHGSRFSLTGAVKNGPAKESLPHYKLSLATDGTLAVHLHETVSASYRLRVDL